MAAKRNIRVPGPGGGFKDREESQDRSLIRVREPANAWLKRPGELVVIRRRLMLRRNSEQLVEGCYSVATAPAAMTKKDDGFLCEANTHAVFLGLKPKKALRSVVGGPKATASGKVIAERGLIAETLPVFYVSGVKIVIEDIITFGVVYINTDRKEEGESGL